MPYPLLSRYRAYRLNTINTTCTQDNPCNDSQPACCKNQADRVETRYVAKTIPIWPIEMDERHRVIFQIAPESCCDSRGAAPFVAFVPQGTSRASQSGTTFTTDINASNGTRLSTRLML